MQIWPETYSYTTNEAVSAGIPIINNIGGDVWEMVDAEKVGVNVSINDYQEKVLKLLELTSKQYKELCDAVKETHRKYFSIDCVSKVISSLL